MEKGAVKPNPGHSGGGASVAATHQGQGIMPMRLVATMDIDNTGRITRDHHFAIEPTIDED